MALVYCPECGTQSSDQAIACPKCAYPISKIFGKKPISTVEYEPVEESHDTLIAFGYISAVVSLLFIPILFMLIGIILGIITITKGETNHGTAHIILSIVFGIIGIMLGVAFYNY